MYYQLRIVDIGQAFYDLLEEVLCHIFFELSSLSYISKEIPSRAEFHHKADMLAGLKGIVKSDYILVIALF